MAKINLGDVVKGAEQLSLGVSIVVALAIGAEGNRLDMDAVCRYRSWYRRSRPKHQKGLRRADKKPR